MQPEQCIPKSRACAPELKEEKRVCNIVGVEDLILLLFKENNTLGTMGYHLIRVTTFSSGYFNPAKSTIWT